MSKEALAKDRTITIGSRWRHYKNNVYVIKDIGKFENGGGRAIIYHHIDQPKSSIPWVRAEADFLSLLPDGTPRFTKIGLCGNSITRT